MELKAEKIVLSGDWKLSPSPCLVSATRDPVGYSSPFRRIPRHGGWHPPPPKTLKGACDEKMTCDFSPDSDSPSNSEPKMFLQHVKIRWSCWDACSDNFHFKCTPKLKVSNSLGPGDRNIPKIFQMTVLYDPEFDWMIFVISLPRNLSF